MKSWDPSAPPVSWAAGRGVYNVSCETTDGSQLGWSYDAATSTLRFGKDKCLDPHAADNRQIWVSDCDSSSKQMWHWGSRASGGDFAELHQGATRRSNFTATINDSTAALAVPGAQNSVGFGRKGTLVATTFRINPVGQLQVNNTRQPLSCLAARAINPIAPGMTYELWTKSLADGVHAVLLVNNGEPANVTYELGDLGLSGTWAVRDVWAQEDAGHISAAGSRTVALGVHASALHVLRPPPAGTSDGGATVTRPNDGLRFGPSSASLRDDPIHGDALEYLDGNDWVLSSHPAHTGRAAVRSRSPPPPAPVSMSASVPGDIISDLHRAGLIDDPYYERNWLNSSLWASQDWTYTKTFTVPSLPPAGGELLLVFDGIKMGATVKLNGMTLTVVTNQFVRTAIPLRASRALVAGQNTLSVVFNMSIECDGRWMGCSGGWDWAPYSNTFATGAGAAGEAPQTHTLTSGIWKSVSLVTVGGVAVTHQVCHTYYRGDFPTKPLADGDHGGFDVAVRVYLWAPRSGKVRLAVSGSWSASAAKTVTVDLEKGDSNITVTLQADASDIELWWPAGSGLTGTYGARPTLYSVSVVLTDPEQSVTGATTAVKSTRKVGFRTVALVTGNDTDPIYVERAAAQEGSDTHGMYFRINGAVTMALGASMIPMEQMEGWMSADVRQLFKIVKKIGTNF